MDPVGWALNYTEPGSGRLRAWAAPWRMVFFSLTFFSLFQPILLLPCFVAFERGCLLLLQIDSERRPLAGYSRINEDAWMIA